MMSLGNLDETARFLATSRGTDFFPVNISVFSAELHPFLTSRWLIVSCPGNGVQFYTMSVPPLEAILASAPIRVHVMRHAESFQLIKISSKCARPFGGLGTRLVL